MHKKQLIAGLLLLTAACGGISTPTAAPTSAQSLPVVTSTPAATPKPVPAASLPQLTATPIPTRALTAGDTRIRASDGMIMLYVPAGDFIMGAAKDDPVADQHEKPEHVVYLDAFWIDQTETTNAQYQRCVKAGICQAPLKCDFGEPTYSDKSKTDHPVVCVNWHDAETYCQWAGGQLPTEAQWEKAARGTAGQRYPWGDMIDCSRGNFDDETILDEYVVPPGEGCDGYPQTAPVGSFPSGSSPYGALDMAGNVWEWVSDWLDWSYYDHSPHENPTGPMSGDMRAVRGGSWHYGFKYVRAATRHCAPADHRANALGIRCVAPDGPAAEK